MPNARELLESARGYEASGLFDRALATFAKARETTSHPAIVAEALRHEADIHRTRCEWPEALEAARQSAATAEAAGLTGELAEALNAEAGVFHTRGEFSTANALYHRILELPVNDRIRGIAYQNLALVSIQTGHPDNAEKYFQQSVDYFRRAGYARGEVIALVNYGRSRLDHADPKTAVTILREAEKRAIYLADLDVLAVARLNYAEALFEDGDDDRAFEITCTALGHFDSTRNAFRRLECLRILGDIHRRHHENADARNCYQAALAIAERIEAHTEADQLKIRMEAVGE